MIQITASGNGNNAHGMSRRNETNWLAGVSPRASGSISAAIAKAMAAAACRDSLAQACRPSERALLILIQVVGQADQTQGEHQAQHQQPGRRGAESR